MTLALLIFSYFVIGIVFSTIVTALDIRDEARKGVAEEKLLDGVGIIFAICAPLWPLCLVWCVGESAYHGLLKTSKKLARVDKLPEVQERKRKELEKELELADA